MPTVSAHISIVSYYFLALVCLVFLRSFFSFFHSSDIYGLVQDAGLNEEDNQTNEDLNLSNESAAADSSASPQKPSSPSHMTVWVCSVSLSRTTAMQCNAMHQEQIIYFTASSMAVEFCIVELVGRGHITRNHMGRISITKRERGEMDRATAASRIVSWKCSIFDDDKPKCSKSVPNRILCKTINNARQDGDQKVYNIASGGKSSWLMNSGFVEKLSNAVAIFLLHLHRFIGSNTLS